ncbi:hypothetical protein [uncultured Ramlibacter sp.]|uniref:hypothetical protein n=1 Tax=uncultured Ramlibacter sp. TaxID=260755 RepID=UPI002627512A|nr:hypothetical protein [uncultured Ramlibacter sp.]
MSDTPQTSGREERSDFLNALLKGVLLGAVVLAIVLPWRLGYFSKQPAPPSPAVATAPAPSQALPPTVPPPPKILADFGREPASDDARQVANWALYSGDNAGKSVVIVDKRQAKVYLFSPQGELKGATPALLGLAHGDHTVPGIGDLPLSQVTPDMRTTPAGRFVAEAGVNTHNEDIVWVDYNAAVSMHRVRPLVKAERRLERLASATADDNRISYGCINLPVAFYEKVLSPTVRGGGGAIIYVLPETQTAAALFGSYNPPVTQQVAQR